MSDGDTITVLDSGKQQHKIRVAGIDAPEKNQPFGQRSKENLPVWCSARRSMCNGPSMIATSASWEGDGGRGPTASVPIAPRHWTRALVRSLLD